MINLITIFSAVILATAALSAILYQGYKMTKLKECQVIILTFVTAIFASTVFVAECLFLTGQSVQLGSHVECVTHPTFEVGFKGDQMEVTTEGEIVYNGDISNMSKRIGDVVIYNLTDTVERNVDAYSNPEYINKIKDSDLEVKYQVIEYFDFKSFEFKEVKKVVNFELTPKTPVLVYKNY